MFSKLFQWLNSDKNITSLNSFVEAKGSAFAAGYKRQQQKATDTYS